MDTNFLPQQWSTVLSHIMPIMADESDRGCILVAHSYLDEQMGEILKIHFRTFGGAEETLLNELLGTTAGGYAPIQGFPLRLKLAIACGMIDSELKGTLEAFNTFRNGFAHRSHTTKLTDDSLKPILNKINNLPPKLIDIFNGFLKSSDNTKKEYYTSARTTLIGIAAFLCSYVEIILMRGIEKSKSHSELVSYLKIHAQE
jgi:DNA-binding MltR family transcriptional regulator